jgi:hypothetical protein
MLHITNGDATRLPLERSGVPGEIASWDDVLHEGPTPLASGDAWVRVRARHLASAGYGAEDDLLRDFLAKGDPLDAADQHDEVVFWFEHDLYDQLLLIRHLWWLSRNRPSSTRLSIVMGTDYLGLLKPEQFPAKFETRQPISEEQIGLGSEAWTAYCGPDPGRLAAFSDLPPEGGSSLMSRVEGLLPFVPRAMHRILEEFPAVGTGLARSERQILEVLSEGPRSPEQTFVAASRLEEDIWMGDWSFWAIVRRLAAGAHPLVAADVTGASNRLPEGTIEITDAGRRVLAGRADYLALSAPSRWIGGTLLAPQRAWRWTGSALLPPAP